MKKEDCFYCYPNAKLDALMLKLGTLDCAAIYLFRDQKYPGRCVVALDEHYDEMFQVPAGLRDRFMNAVSRVAEAIYTCYGADKINYAIYGDLVSHFHVHVVPKKKGGPQWGGPFTDDAEKIYLKDTEYTQAIAMLRNALNMQADDA